MLCTRLSEWEKTATAALLGPQAANKSAATTPAQIGDDEAVDPFKAVADEWAVLVDATARLLTPLKSVFDAAVVDRPASARAATPSGKKGSKAAPPPPEGGLVVLCISDKLSSLPLEALPFWPASVSAVSRDFGLHLLAGRARNGAGGRSTAPVSKTSYVVDPRAGHVEACVGTPGCSALLQQSFSTAVLASYGSEWTGLVGGGSSRRVPSQGEYIRLLSAQSLFVFCGVGVVAQHITPPTVLTADLGGLSLAVVMDRVPTDAIARTASHDLARQPACERVMWSAHGMAAGMLSRGALSVAINARVSAADEVTRVLAGLLAGCAPGDVPAAQVLRSVCADAHALSARMPWLAHNVLVYGLPSVTLLGSSTKDKKK